MGRNRGADDLISAVISQRPEEMSRQKKIAAATGSWAGDATVAADFSPQRGLGRVALRESQGFVVGLTRVESPYILSNRST